MALLIDTAHKGIPVQQAYVTVELPTITPDKVGVSFSIWFRSAPGQEPFRSVSCDGPYSLEGSDPFSQAYEHLKTLPEFEGCTDC
jgi:hypothetical protein